MQLSSEVASGTWHVLRPDSDATLSRILLEGPDLGLESIEGLDGEDGQYEYDSTEGVDDEDHAHSEMSHDSDDPQVPDSEADLAAEVHRSGILDRGQTIHLDDDFDEWDGIDEEFFYDMNYYDISDGIQFGTFVIRNFSPFCLQSRYLFHVQICKAPH